MDPALLEQALLVLPSYGMEGARVTPVSIGLINRTFVVEPSGGGRFVLQKVNPIFTPLVHEDIEAVTRHLEARGLMTPRLIRARAGRLFVESGGAIWRLMTFIEGETRERLAAPSEAREAGVLLARFHRAVADLSHEFRHRRLGVHDTPKHLAALASALEEHRDLHPRHDVVRPLGEEVLAFAQALPRLPGVEDRVVHGDPKISNLLFDRSTGAGVAIVDLDTLAKMPLPLELGDAFRSWCNPSGEDATKVKFSLELFRAAVRGYAEVARGFIRDAEWRSIVPATETIIIELASRFAADALNERYFGWDSARFRTRGEHNELRARGQVALAKSLAVVRAEAQAIVEEAFA
jgi:Ser/Thr protein kinase RdoA (MazF antagonist)